MTESETKRPRLYPTDFKLKVIKQSKDKRCGGVVKVAKEWGISRATLSTWRRDEALFLEDMGLEIEAPVEKGYKQKRLLSCKQEREMAEWCRHFQGQVTRRQVVERVCTKHPDLFSARGPSDALAARRKVENWVYNFLRRNNIPYKGREAAVADSALTSEHAPTAAAAETGRTAVVPRAESSSEG